MIPISKKGGRAEGDDVYCEVPEEPTRLDNVIGVCRSGAFHLFFFKEGIFDKKSECLAHLLVNPMLLKSTIRVLTTILKNYERDYGEVMIDKKPEPSITTPTSVH